MRDLRLAVILTVLFVGASIGWAGGDPSASAARKASVRAYVEQIINRGDWAVWSELFAEKVSFNGQTMTESDMQGMLAAFRSILPDMRIQVEEQIAEGEVVASRVTITGTHEGDYMGLKASGKKLTFSGLTYDRFRDGKIVEMWHEMNIWGTLLMASDD